MDQGSFSTFSMPYTVLAKVFTWLCERFLFYYKNGWFSVRSFVMFSQLMFDIDVRMM